MNAAVNAPVASAMGLALLDFLWALRYHPAALVECVSVCECVHVSMYAWEGYM